MNRVHWVLSYLEYFCNSQSDDVELSTDGQYYRQYWLIIIISVVSFVVIRLSSFMPSAFKFIVNVIVVIRQKKLALYVWIVLSLCHYVIHISTCDKNCVG